MTFGFQVQIFLELLPQMVANHIGGVMVGVLYCGRLLVQIRLVVLFLR
jgi:hypothetical protein